LLKPQWLFSPHSTALRAGCGSVEDAFFFVCFGGKAAKTNEKTSIPALPEAMPVWIRKWLSNWFDVAASPQHQTN
jgi:hypothetical protein